MIQAQIILEATNEMLLDKSYNESDMYALRDRLNDYCIWEGLNQMGQLIIKIRPV